MEQIIKDEMSDEEFQFYKLQLKNDVKSYLDLDDQIKALNKAVSDRRKEKKKLSETILSTMKSFEIDNMNTKNGRLIYNVSKRAKPLNKKNLISGLDKYFKNVDKSKEVSKIILDNREVVEKIQLRRTINKTVNNFSV
tara:strand:+ start:271 stop:684 length:414 start_codon:yes stop_codon:yes gene_type:complete